MGKTKIGHDTQTYNLWFDKEQTIFEKYNDLKALAVKVLGDEKLISDEVEFAKEPYNYVLNVFWDTYCQNEPQHINRDNIFQSKTGLSKEQFETAEGSFKNALRAMSQHTPTMEKNGLKSNLESENFNIYLNPDKAEEFDAVKSFMESAKALKDKFNGGGGMHIVRMHESIFIGTNGNPELNLNYYRA